MSFNSIHMENPADGYRYGEQKELTKEEARTFDWDGSNAVNPDLDGHTKWRERTIIYFFFKKGMILHTTALAIGYSIGMDKTKKHKKGSGSLESRLSRISTKKALPMLRIMYRAKALENDFAWLLDPDRTTNMITKFGKYKKSGRPHSQQRIRFSKALCRASVEKYITCYEAAKQLKIDIKVLLFWLSKDDEKAGTIADLQWSGERCSLIPIDE